MTHKLWFDYISLIEFSIRPISPLGGKAINGDLVNFMWEMPRTDYILDIEIEVSRDKGFKKKRIVKELNKVYPLLLAKDALDISISSNNKSIHHLTKFVDKGLISKYRKGIIKEGYYLK